VTLVDPDGLKASIQAAMSPSAAGVPGWGDAYLIVPCT
jgi:hypothetical protein